MSSYIRMAVIVMTIGIKFMASIILLKVLIHYAQISGINYRITIYL